MRHIVFYFFTIILTISNLEAQNFYFPPITGDTWETIAPSTLGWCADEIDSLYNLVEGGNSKALIILKDGKIVLEKYFNGHDATYNWQWASAGKTLTAFAVGMVQEEGLLDIDNPTSDYLGQGWTSCSAAEEELITVRHQLTMTSGLDDSGNSYCTDPSCLNCIAAPNERWAYHNGPYTLLLDIIGGATGQGFNQVLNTRLKNRIGMQGISLPIGDNRVYFSTARSMARFGLLMLNQGIWDSDTLMKDQAYFNAQITPSQTLNESYGYLWWLNGKDSYKLPGSQINFPGSPTPNAPDDMFAGIGAQGQYMCIVPSENMVVIRMGENPDQSVVPIGFLDEMWKQIGNLACGSTHINQTKFIEKPINIHPNPSKNRVFYEFPNGNNQVLARLYSMQGQLIFEGQIDGFLDKPEGLNGTFLLHLIRKNEEARQLVIFEN